MVFRQTPAHLLSETALSAQICVSISVQLQMMRHRLGRCACKAVACALEHTVQLMCTDPFGCFLQVRFVQADAIQKQLNGGHIVLLGNLAYSAAGEVLNCDCYSVATQAAIDLQADKLFCLTTPSLQPFDLPHWLPISDAEHLLTSLLQTNNDSQAEQSSGAHHFCL